MAMAVGAQGIEQHRHFLFRQVLPGSVGAVWQPLRSDWSLFAIFYDPQVLCFCWHFRLSEAATIHNMTSKATRLDWLFDRIFARL
jgi:hypothetical protein